MRVDVKFRETAPEAGRQRVIEEVTRLGATKVEPLFPGETDDELASLYKVEGIPDEQGDEALAAIEKLDEVEFAERTPERKLIR